MSSGNATPCYNPRPEIVALRDALQNLQFSGGRLRAGMAEAKRLLDAGDEPNGSDWPGRIPGDPKYISICPGKRAHSYALLPEYKARKIGWPKLLDDLSANLASWWSAWRAAQAALDGLPLEATANLGVGARTRKPWASRVRRTLRMLADPIQWTNPTSNVGPDVAGLLSHLREHDLPDWPERFADLRRYDGELLDLGGEHDAPAVDVDQAGPTWQDLAERFERIRIEARTPNEIPDGLMWVERSSGVLIREGCEGLEAGPERWERIGEPILRDGCGTPAARFDDEAELAGAKLLQLPDLPDSLRNTANHRRRWCELLTVRPDLVTPASREVATGQDGERRHWTMRGILEASVFWCRKMAAAGDLQSLLTAGGGPGNATQPQDAAHGGGQAKPAGGGGRQDVDPHAYLTPRRLAELYDVPFDALRSRLRRWQQANPAGGWMETTGRKPNEPQFLYQVAAVKPIIEKLRKTTSETTSERPAKKS